MANTDLHKGTERDEEVYSISVKAGRRTYFFDVKATLKDDYFITITESRRMGEPDPNGKVPYNKDKIYLYKEDFDKFTDNLQRVIDFIKAHKPEFFEREAVVAGVSDSIDEEFEML